jgi:cation:H+ antiporter
MLLMTLLLLAGFAALYFGADWMVRGAARLGTSLGMSSIVIGLTVVSLGTSAPELFVAIMATMRGSADIAVGNVLGSNLANIGLILGLTAIICPLRVAGRVVTKEMPIMVGLTLLVVPLVMDGDVSRLDGMILTALLAAYLGFVFFGAKRQAPTPLLNGVSQLTEGLTPPEARKRMAILGDVGLLVAGTAGLVLGGRAVVESGTFLSREFGVSELVIGLTVVAIGTSLPELATSILAATRKQTDIAVGNVIGSNIFNLAAVLGITGIVTPIDVDPGVLWVELPALLVLSALVFFVTISPRRKGEFLILRWEGALLLVAYLGLGAWILW